MNVDIAELMIMADDNSCCDFFTLDMHGYATRVSFEKDGKRSMRRRARSFRSSSFSGETLIVLEFIARLIAN